MLAFIRNRWVGIVGALALVTGIALLVACSAGITKGGIDASVGPSAWTAVEHGEAIAQEGRDEGDPVKTLFGQILTGIGAIGVSLFGTGRLIKRYDNKPYTAEDVASLKAAGDAPPPPKA